MVHPGRITKDHVNGKRVSYTNPFRFLFSLVIIYLLAVSFNSNFSALNAYTLDWDNTSLIYESGSLTFNFGNEEQQKQLAQVMDSLRLSYELINVSGTLKIRILSY